MAFNATPMQQKAIETDGNVLVSAAAGSGKTAVLVERVIRMLTSEQNPISADRLLIVTFTNAAAAEMRSRIEKRLHEEILKNPDDVALLRQKHLLPSADICTIDSFCIKLIRENFDVCGCSALCIIHGVGAVEKVKAGKAERQICCVAASCIQ